MSDSDARDFVHLHEHVQGSLDLLNNLEEFLGTFQTDLNAVSGHISELQTRSKDFDAKLRSRRDIHAPLGELVKSITISPTLVTTFLDTPVSSTWNPAIKELEALMDAVRINSTGVGEAQTPLIKVRAAKDVEGVAEGLKILAATKIRAHFLTIFEPVRSSLSTNLQVLQSSILLNKYKPLFRFLQRKTPVVAAELRQTYTSYAKLYYETGMRRYARSLASLKGRADETVPPIGILSDSVQPRGLPSASERLKNGSLDGPPAILSYQCEDKNFIAPIEAVYRSGLLVLLDNASSEYAFIREFFKSEPLEEPAPPPVTARPSLPRDVFDSVSVAGSPLRSRPMKSPMPPPLVNGREEEKMFETLWKQIFQTVTPYMQTLVDTLLTPTPPAIPLLTMIHFTNVALNESSLRRDCSPLEPFLMGLRLKLWPIFQRNMGDQIESVKKLADSGGAQSGYLPAFWSGSKASINDTGIVKVIERYIALFASAITLSSEEDEAILFGSLNRLRNEVMRVISAQVSKMKDPIEAANFTSQMCESVLRQLSERENIGTHPKAQAESAFWRERNEEAKRRILSAARS